MPVYKLHPLAKSDIELRRGIERLHNFQVAHPQDAAEYVVEELISRMRVAREAIPSEFRNQDIQGE